eukprot:c53563_g1_i1 orf=20-232(-)
MDLAMAFPILSLQQFYAYAKLSTVQASTKKVVTALKICLWPCTRDIQLSFFNSIVHNSGLTNIKAFLFHL